jgi:hypothetical protein
MIAEFNNAIIKVWFNSISTSRNFKNVSQIRQEQDTALITTSDGSQHLLNMRNVNLIEEIENKEDAKMGKKMLELREQFKKER